MALKKLGVAMLAVFAMCAIVASTSQAQQWKIAGSNLTTSDTATASTSTTGVITSKILGSPFKLTWTKLSSKEGKITQTGSGATGVSKLTGTLLFENVTFDEPAGCKSSGTIETVPLTGTAQMGNTEATKSNVYVKVAPTSGEVFGTFKVSECAPAGSYQFKGSFYVKAANPTGTEKVVQEGATSGAITSSQGGAVTIGKEPATLEGNILVALSGTNAGRVWGLTEK
jgi:hypothetical protein